MLVCCKNKNIMTTSLISEPLRVCVRSKAARCALQIGSTSSSPRQIPSRQFQHLHLAAALARWKEAGNILKAPQKSEKASESCRTNRCL